MASMEFKNNSKSTVADAPLAAGVTTLNVAAGEGANFPATFPFLLTIWHRSAYPNPGDDSGMEIVRCTGRTTDALTIVRAQEGTADVDHTFAEDVVMLITAGHFDDSSYGIVTKLDTIETDAKDDQTGSEIVTLINAGANLIDDDNIASTIARDSEVSAYFDTSTGHDHDDTDSKKVVGGNITNTPAGNIVATDVQAAITELDSQDTTHAALTTGIHGVAGNVVGTSDTQTLSNKTFSDQLNAATGRCATLVVAANDSSALSKAQADYVCDGTDDDVEIQAAIDALPTGGGKVSSMEGSYSGGKIQIQKSNVVLEGIGRGSVYTLLAGSNTEAIEVGDGSTPFSNIEIKNLKIDGNNATGTKYTIHFNKNITHSMIYNVEVTNSSGDGGIYISGSDNNLINSCRVHGNDIRGILLIDNSNDNIISNNNVYSNGGSGIYLKTGTGLPITRNTITGNVVNNNGHGGIVANGDLGNFYHNTITGNTCNENIDGVGGIYLAYPNCKYNTITGNTCNNNTGNGIQLYKGSYNTITGNTAKGNPLYYGVYLQLDCHHNLVSGNILQGNWWGLGLHESMYNIIDNNQIVENSYDGIRCLSNSDYCKISNNYIYGNCVLSSNYDGIALQSDNCVFHHNTYIANGAQRYGLHILTGGDNNIIHDEIFQVGGITDNIYDEGSGNNIQRCLGYITENSGTATLANGTTSFVVSHGLDKTPVIGDIMITPIEAWGAMTGFYIDTYTSTQFTIHSDQDPGQDVDFAWKAIVL